MKALPAIITDPIYEKPSSLSRYELFWLRHMNDKRDMPFLHLLTYIHLTIVPLTIILYSPLLQGIWWWLLLIPQFLLSQIFLRGSFGLMLHNITHRRMFKKSGANWLNKYITWVICPLFGQVPESYFAHHVGMHHVENNMPEDASSTMPYQRDSVKDFLRYYGHFVLHGATSTFMYLFTRQKNKYYVPLSAGQIILYVICVALCFVNFKATLWILIIPLIFSRLVMMLGNWTQHAFVDPNDPANTFKSTYNCINTGYNHKCWNDGYHLIHHLKPGAHYTEMPVMFLKEKERMVEQQTLVFDGVHYLHLFFYLMTKNYNKMADNLVNINNAFSSREEAIAVMKERTRRLV